VTRDGVPRRPLVALVAHDIHDDGGMERAFAELIRHAHADVDFVVFAATLAEDLRPYVKWRPVHVPRRPFPVKLVTFMILAGLRVRRSNVDLVHTLGAILPRRVDLVSVHFCQEAFRHVRSTQNEQGRSRLRGLNAAVSFWLAWCIERWYWRSDRVRAMAAVSVGTAREVARYYPGIPVHVTPNGVDLERFVPDDSARRTLRHEERLVDEDVVAIFVGGRWEDKGLPLVFDSLCTASAKLPVRRLHLWVVGRGDEALYGRLAARLAIASRVRFFGFRSDVERFLQAADVFVFPSSYETFSLVAHEAAACGLPVIATPVNGIDELVLPGETGYLVPADAAALAEALAHLARTPSLRKAMGQRARERVGTMTWQRSAASVVDIYRSLLAPTTRTDSDLRK